MWYWKPNQFQRLNANILIMRFTCVTCINFFTTSLLKIWSKTVCRNGSSIMDSFSLSRCQMRIRDSSIAVIETYNKTFSELECILLIENINFTCEKSSVDTPNHSGESRNWFEKTMCKAFWFCDTTSLSEKFFLVKQQCKSP